MGASQKGLEQLVEWARAERVAIHRVAFEGTSIAEIDFTDLHLTDPPSVHAQDDTHAEPQRYPKDPAGEYAARNGLPPPPEPGDD